MSLDDLDLEKVEHLLKAGRTENQPNVDSGRGKQEESSREDRYTSQKRKEKEKVERKRSRSRSKSSPYKKSQSRSSPRDRKRSPKRRNSHSSKSRSSDRSKEKREPRSRPLEKQNRYEKPEKNQRSEKYDSKNDSKTEGKRGDLTCLVMNLTMDTTEKDIFFFLTKKAVGKIRDIKIIRDLKNGKSKGVAYIEFYDKEAVENTIALSGTVLCGNEIRIQHSQAEKNRVSLSEKPNPKFNKPLPKKSLSPENQGLGSKRIYVGGLTDHLADLKEQDIKQLFSSFGEVDSVVIHRDPLTGRGKGYAFVQFKNVNDAKEAVEKMDGMLIGNKTLKVSSVQSNLAGTINSFNNYANSESLDLDDESGHNFLHNSQSRALLMQKLTRANHGNSLVGMKGKSDEISQTPTNCLLFINMYTQEDIMSCKNFLTDLKTQLMEECKKFGEVRHMFLDPGVEGNIWVKFKEIQFALNAQKNLNDRYFAGRKMTLFFVKEEFFKKKFAV